MNVGYQIKALRESKSISKEQMCDHLHMSLNTYKKIEYGEKIPTLDDLKIIAGVFDVDPTIFLKEDKTSIVNNGDYSTGIGNVVINEKDLILHVTKSIDGLAEAISAMTKAIDKK
ncbi:MAG: helix-turn-helix domain-containing protein [Chitinophagales bacterium]|nr:helix-turn-helix domain-containing protein [Chitinophagales bacterium]